MIGGGRIRGGRLCAGAILGAAVLALHAASALASSCSVSNVASYSGTVSLSYTGSVSDVSDGNGGTASESMKHSGDDLTTGPMTPDKADQDFTSTSLGGTVTIDDNYSDTNDGQTTTASLTGNNAPDPGSDASISFVPSSCVYSISASVGASGTHSGVFADPGISDAASSPNMPIPSDLDLSGSITIKAYGTGPLTLAGVEAGFYEFGPFSTWAQEMAQLLGVDPGSGDLGPAQLSWDFTPTFKTKVCDVPTVAGKALSAAKTALTKANCAAGTITQQSSTTVPKGDVISSNPPAGNLEPAGTKVNLVESSGPPPKNCIVPSLAGQTLAAAKTALKAANCAEGKLTKKASSTVPKGDVISSSPAVGTTHTLGTKVALTVSSGKKAGKGKGSTKNACKVPSVKGKTLAAAKSALKHAHCGVGAVTKKASAKVAKGKVISSKPGAGSKHKAGTKVALTVSSGKHGGTGTTPKKACVVPTVVGDTLAAAKAALKKANCSTGTVTKKASGTVTKGDVISSSPKAGTKHKAGTKVKLTVSSGPGYSVPKS